MKRCPTCKQPVPNGARAYVRWCGKCGKAILLHHKWVFKFVGKNVQMQHRQCEFPTHYMTFEDYAKQYGKDQARIMYGREKRI
jgi:hypothetical protein